MKELTEQIQVLVENWGKKLTPQRVGRFERTKVECDPANLVDGVDVVYSCGTGNSAPQVFAYYYLHKDKWDVDLYTPASPDGDIKSLKQNIKTTDLYEELVTLLTGL